MLIISIEKASVSLSVKLRPGCNIKIKRVMKKDTNPTPTSMIPNLMHTEPGIPKLLFFQAFHVYPIKCQCCPHIETSQLICCAIQLTGFYMRATLIFNGLNVKSRKHLFLRNSILKLYSSALK